ncbi:hypothetical protein [Streptomyces tubercidicus]|uniref:Uncharacterized protein n=1 Tax=Streptomyces tubercidicus TaxID=47759 RepID=A0A640UYJ9_9ACTN|nr:hypothetical protein [Streptomyces tubercidicus]WAU15400.1 hypothetical protein STRTU_006110 [Streptomyces tubercidicus]GFE41248.1 hypothetical protein Stube_59210 [Streptomyces tubercidicus]
MTGAGSMTGVGPMSGGGPLAGPGAALARGGADGEGLVHHLLVDQALKVGIVLVALIVLVMGMALIWKKAGRGGPSSREDG